MSELHWSTCNYCNTQDHTTPFHEQETQDQVPASLHQQPDPNPQSRRDVLPLVMADYRARMDYYAGPTQYGVPLRIDNLRDHLRDAYAEALDLPGYLKAAIVLWDEMRETMEKIHRLSADVGTYYNYDAEQLLMTVQLIHRLTVPYLDPETTP